jgi:hypothetical protein
VTLVLERGRRARPDPRDHLAGRVRALFERAVALLGADEPPDPAALDAMAADHGLEIDLASIPRLIKEHGLS